MFFYSQFNDISFIFIFFIAIVLSVFSCILVKKYFYILNIVDVPNDRSSHEQAVVLSAGVGFLFVLGCLVFFIVPDLIIANIYIVLSLLFLSLVSFYDDLKGLSNKFRIFIHFLVGNVFYFSNIKFLSLNLFFLDIVLNDYVSYFCTVFFVVALINIYNFMDGIDGYAGGVGVISSLFFGVSFLMIQNINLALICFVLAGALLGFLFFNFPSPKASVFMGDVGSAVLGAIFAFFSIKYSMVSYDFSYSIIIPMMVLGVFLCDASVTLCIRFFKKENIFQAHRSHFYQKLNIIGWSHQKIVLLEYIHLIVCILLVLGIFYGWEKLCIILFIISFIFKFTTIQRSYNRR
tara:strand:+ start:1583 stop:2623 length:1041 start_codon:yes stop_codon:yes gene_type:complete